MKMFEVKNKNIKLKNTETYKIFLKGKDALHFAEDVLGCDCASAPQEAHSGVKAEAPYPSVQHHGGVKQDGSPSRLSKEELIQSMDRVDREIAKVEQQIFKLKKKQVTSRYWTWEMHNCFGITYFSTLY